ncbi:MAG: metallophosphoesterase family protein [Clostridia bacterium]|nr:metallophosphoesterase family protein [Clostridia bacterium]
MRILFLGDLHGNWPATLAMEEAIRGLDADDIWFLGDAVGKGPSSDLTCDWVRAHCRHWIGGNWDYGVGGREFSEDGFFWDQLGEERLSWLRGLPPEDELTFSGLRFRLFHGRPLTPLLMADSPREEFEAVLVTDWGRFDGAIFADSHRAFVRTLNGAYVCNAGSVGNNLGVPRAHALLLEDRPLRMTILSVPYDNEAAAEDARKAKVLLHCDAYIREVLTGVYSR